MRKQAASPNPTQLRTPLYFSTMKYEKELKALEQKQLMAQMGRTPVGGVSNTLYYQYINYSNDILSNLPNPVASRTAFRSLGKLVEVPCLPFQCLAEQLFKAASLFLLLLPARRTCSTRCTRNTQAQCDTRQLVCNQTEAANTPHRSCRQCVSKPCSAKPSNSSTSCHHRPRWLHASSS